MGVSASRPNNRQNLSKKCNICIKNNIETQCSKCKIHACGVCCSQFIYQVTPTSNKIAYNVCQACISNYLDISINTKCKGCYKLIANNKLIKLCHICTQLNPVVYLLNSYMYCSRCDNLHANGEYYNDIHKCDKYDKRSGKYIMRKKPDRSLLPHYKAKPIIEEIYYIKGIAQIIFDYYYTPRRYYDGEI